MTRTISVTVGDRFSRFISEQVRAGRYGSAGDVVEAGLRMLEEHEAKVKALQDALTEGERSGEFRPFDFEGFKARKRTEHQRR